METRPDIERLRKKRQRNVQEQNSLVEYGLRTEAIYWREHALPKALRDEGLARGVDWDNSIILDLVRDFPGMPRLYGLLLSQDETFISFEIDTDKLHENIIDVEEWSDCSSMQNLNTHNRGTGMGWGAQAILIRRELCATPADKQSL
ncbi:MAG: hypothetical protein HY254_08120 [Burkholderiales bacterium]|nr:hypothetical protein [Burkholderiales bacterium]